MRAFIGTASALILVVIVGCASKKDQPGRITGVSSKQAAEMEGRRSPFESSEDPPFTATTRFAAGQLAESQGALPQAIAQYVETVKLDPSHQGAWFRLGVLYARAKQYPKAIDAWEHYVKATDGAAAAYSNLGFCHEVAGDAARAERAYRQGIERDPKHVPCRVNFGLMLARKGRESEALDQLCAVLTPAQAHYNVGSVYEQQGRKDQAKKQYRKALELDATFEDAETRLAQMK
jgi:tetratricopeptide (TPR) repeat protein